VARPATTESAPDRGGGRGEVSPGRRWPGRPSWLGWPARPRPRRN